MILLNDVFDLFIIFIYVYVCEQVCAGALWGQMVSEPLELVI